MFRPLRRALLALLSSFGINVSAQSPKSNGFWSMGTDRQWTREELDAAFVVFKKLKDQHGDRFNFIVQDLRREGTPKADGTKTAEILIKIYVTSPDKAISMQLESVGMVFVKAP